MASECRSQPLELSRPESAVGRDLPTKIRPLTTAQGTKLPLTSEFLTAALEKTLTKIGSKTQISKTLSR